MIDKIRTWIPLLSGLSFWPKLLVSVIAIIILLAFLMAIWAPDKVIIALEVQQVLPVYVYSDDSSGDPHMGISMIVKVKNRDKKSLVNGIDLRGKLYLSGNDILAFFGKDGENIEKRLNESAAKKPYYEVHWTGWTDQESRAISLEPYEIRYIKFTILAPTLAGADRGMILYMDYIGYGDGSKVPTKQKSHPFLWEFFSLAARPDVKGWLPTGLRDELINGELKIYINVNSTELVVGPDKLLVFKMIKANEWTNKPTEYLFHDKYN
jgi:hypothetical protein